MTTDDVTRDKKLQFVTTKGVTKILTLSSGKINKHEYLTAEEILRFDQSRIIQQAKFTYSPLGKRFWKTNKNNWKSSSNAHIRTWRAWKTIS